MVGGHKLWNETLKHSVMHSKTPYLEAEYEAVDVHTDDRNTTKDMYNKVMMPTPAIHPRVQTYENTFSKIIHYIWLFPLKDLVSYEYHLSF